jgi:3',5'-cyclic AMP phosphodiesterase CpdA
MKPSCLKKIPALVALLTAPLAVQAQFTTPHLSNIPGDVTNVLDATTFINHGLVGIGHISASALDSFGETFGSASSLQVTGFTNNGDGTYNGTLNVLPDRGYNSGNFYSHYRARINQVGFKFTPYSGTTNIGGTTDLDKLNAQTNQFTFGSIGGVLFTYFDPITGSNSYTTGLDPGTNYATIFGKPMPYVGTYVGQQSPSDATVYTYTNINKLPLDSEALVLKADGSGYIGDEYGANVYYFNSSKQIVDAIVPPPAFQPHSPVGILNYNSVNPPLNGRRNNQGFEGVSLSPDGTRLFALLQTACVQDGQQSANNQLAKNTRLLIYDVSTNPVPTNAIGEYVLTLPTYKSSGNGSTADKTCAQSEIVALDNYRFLVLPRDGNGLGNNANNPNVYKTLLLVDTRVGGPTNIVNDAARNAEGGTIISNGVAGTVDPTITTLSWVEAVNMLNTNQLAKFNVQWDSGTNQVTKLTMGEKWEGVAMVSCKDTNNPNDYFLFVGNDNDFLTSNGQIIGPDGTLVSYNGFAGYPANRIPAPLNSPYNENDTRILAFRVTIAPATVLRSVAYNPAAVTAAQLANGSFALVCQDTNGNWGNAVNLNTGGNAQFVFGAYSTNYTLGTYGVDTNSGTIWAVVNYQGSFAAGAVNNRTNFSALRIASLSDIHYMAPSLLVANGAAFQTYLAGDRKLLAESSAIDKAAMDAVIAQQPDLLLVSGDLTKDGEYVSHVAVSNLLARVTASGTQVFVVPGNHDVNNTNANYYNGDNTTPAANVTPEQFSRIYAPFGYNQAIAKDPNSLSYVVEPVSGLWILCMDSCQYSPGQDPTGGSLPPLRLNWITNELALAQAQGKVVIGMEHHPIMEHFVGMKTLFPDYVLDDYTNIDSIFASYGMKAVFTGHFHAQDIVQGTFNGNMIYDIETGSTVTYPCPYRLIDLMPNGQFAITSHRITAINYNLGTAPDFQTYAYGYLTNGMIGLSAYMLQAAPFNLDSTTANYLAPVVTEALVDHYIGDEPGLAGCSAATRGIVTSLLGGTAQQQQLGGAIYSILTDPAPADNNLTLTLTAGQITGPATNTIIVSGSPTLAWAPVWGAGSYHVTVTGPGYSNSFDVTGTSIVLSGLADGNYTWTVTPNTGTVSSTGGFAVDYPPTLGIEPSTNGIVHVYWPVSSLSSYQLQFSPDLSGTNWVNVSSNGFFRLVK